MIHHERIGKMGILFDVGSFFENFVPARGATQEVNRRLEEMAIRHAEGDPLPASVVRSVFVGTYDRADHVLVVEAIRPGRSFRPTDDQVDLILTQEMDAATAPVAKRIVGETVLTNVRVIAVDQHFTQGASAGLIATGGNNQRSIARTVTLEVQPDQAERVAVAERLGRLSLTVRSMEQSAEQTSSDAAPTSIFGADVSPALSRSGPALGSRIRVIQGSDSQEVTFR